MWFCFRMLILLPCSGTELSAGPRRRDFCYNLSVYYWKLNSLTTLSFQKKIFWMPKTRLINLMLFFYRDLYLDSSIPSDNANLDIKGYKLQRAHNPNNIQRGNACAYIR